MNKALSPLSASLAANESERLSAAHQLNILSAQSNPVFDHLTELASELFSCPIALVLLHGHKHHSVFCDYTVLQDDVFEVSDTLLDHRFAENPLVTDLPFIRFYAGAPLRNTRGQTYGVLCIIDTQPRTLSAQQHRMLTKLALQVNALVSADEQRFQKSLFNNMADAVIVVNEQLNIEQSSKSAVLLLPALTGKGVTPLTDALPELIGPLQQLSGHAPSAAESRFELDVDIPWRGKMSLEFSLSKIFRNGNALWIVLIRDLSQTKRIERMKNEFISTVSHELRTPLTAIRGAIGLLSAGALCEVPEPMRDMLNIAQDNSQRLSLLINDLLDLEKLMAEKFELKMRSVDIVSLLDRVIHTMVPVANNHNVTIIRNSQQPAKIKTDPNRLTQVLSNLLSNACKYSPAHGTVTVTHEVIQGHLFIRVTDHGEGIPYEFRSRIFSKFSQADSSDTRTKDGTGLGLAISKELVELMGGQIGYESEPGHGACFWVKLPIA